MNTRVHKVTCQSTNFVNESGDLKLVEMGTEVVADTLSDVRGFIYVFT